MPADPELVSRFRRARTDPALAVLEGLHALKHALRFGAVIDIAVTSDVVALRTLSEELAPDLADSIAGLVGVVSPAEFAALSPTPPATGVIAVARRRSDTLSGVLAAVAPIILLESPSHGGNIGAVVRAAAAAGAGGVVTTGPNDPWNPGALRGAAGLHYAVPVMRAGLSDLPATRLVAIDPDGHPLAQASIAADSILAFGSERRGLSDELLQRCTARVSIPMERGVSSLNLSTAVAVMLYHWRLAQ